MCASLDADELLPVMPALSDFTLMSYLFSYSCLAASSLIRRRFLSAPICGQGAVSPPPPLAAVARWKTQQTQVTNFKLPQNDWKTRIFGIPFYKIPALCASEPLCHRWEYRILLLFVASTAPSSIPSLTCCCIFTVPSLRIFARASSLACDNIDASLLILASVVT